MTIREIVIQKIQAGTQVTNDELIQAGFTPADFGNDHPNVNTVDEDHEYDEWKDNWLSHEEPF